MEYFTSIENTPYYQWQIELLIESFKKHNLNDNLLIALAESDTLIQPFFFNNLFKHKRILGHENIGKKRGFDKLNILYSLMWAVTSKKISQPFAFIKPDILLQNKIEIKFDSYPQILFSPNSFFSFKESEKQVGEFYLWFDKDKDYYNKNWVPIGNIIIWNQIPEDFFTRLINITEILCVKQIEKNNCIWEKTIELAIVINIADHFGKLSLIGDYSLEDNMLGDGKAKFINYEHGLPPVFNKHMFKYNPPEYSSFGDPFEILSQHSPTPSSYYMSELAKENLKIR